MATITDCLVRDALCSYDHCPNYTHCSRITRNSNFIAQGFCHFPMLIHNGDNLSMYENLRFDGEFLRKVKICTY